MKHFPAGRKPLNPEAFSLVELLAVIGIITLLIALVAPAVKGILGSSGRKGTVIQLMGAFEQARVAALESGAPTYFVLWRRGDSQPDAYLVMRQRTESDPPSPEFVYLTRWQTLPRGVIFYEGTILSAGMPAGFPASLPQIESTANNQAVAAIKINSSGVIEFPVGSPLELSIAEGSRTSMDNPVLVGPKTGEGGVEQFTFSRLTGRVSLKITE